MKKKFFHLLCALGLFLPLMGFASGQNGPESGSNGLRKLENKTFRAGEKLTYRVHYGWLTAGTATLEVKEKPVKIKGHDCYHIVGRGVSAKAFNAIYEVNDSYESFVDRDGLFSWAFKRKISEGNFRAYTEVEFDQEKGKAYEKRHNQDHTNTYDVPPSIQDALSAMYYARTQDYSDAQPGDIYKFQNFIDRKVWDLDVEFIGFEQIKVDGEKYNTVHLKPLVREGGIFKHEGDLHLWISADENRIPVRIESGLVVGAIKVDLVDTKNLLHPLSSRIDD